MSKAIEITGRPDEQEAAAIVAAVTAVLEEEDAAAVQPAERPTPGPWVTAARLPKKPIPRTGTVRASQPPENA